MRVARLQIEAAVSILEAIPNADHLPWLAERISVEKAFIGYHAAIALLNAARSFRTSENHVAVQEAVDSDYLFGNCLQRLDFRSTPTKSCAEFADYFALYQKF